ncbi:IclR family transcriptional regulator [Demequina capsici]|uniref:IclR family transcriptional regulator n=1 Tax=Demequina capsici TaxID=3075620 RepID=A0AA96FC43_9MICO|nr:IclR family transcriptional regulator [Demequina sp. OYTSA14]WNM25580.1 IclR family transcriptional regulator [Demequina sp. OYTSA14]
MAERGAQVVSRVAALLRTLSASAGAPVPTARAAALTGLTRPTAHRLLSGLAAEGLVDRDPDHGWLLGPEAYILGAVAAERYDITALAAEAVREVARLTGESAFLSARRGDETVCLLREEGSFPLRSHVLYEGIRFPLGVASAGLAILAMSPAVEREAYLARTDLTDTWGASHGIVPLRERLEVARRTGYVVNPGLIVEGSWGMAAAIFDASGRPSWALSATGVEARFAPPRQAEIGRVLLEQAHAVGRLIADRGAARRTR